MIQTGNYLFKYRGQIPVFLFIIAIPIVYKNSCYNQLNSSFILIIQYIAIIISFLGLLLRYITIATTPAGTSGRNRKTQIAEELNTTGVYSIVRNPLYLANYIIWLGISIYSLSYLLILIVSVFFILHYERIIIMEEDFLAKKYGQEYMDFIKKTPVFFPRFTNYKKSNNNFSIKSILRQEYSSTLSTIFSFLYIDVLLYYLFIEKINTELDIYETHLTIISISILITIFLKLIKTYTKILEEN